MLFRDFRRIDERPGAYIPRRVYICMIGMATDHTAELCLRWAIGLVYMPAARALSPATPGSVADPFEVDGFSEPSFSPRNRFEFAPNGFGAKTALHSNASGRLRPPRRCTAPHRYPWQDSLPQDRPRSRRPKALSCCQVYQRLPTKTACHPCATQDRIAL